MKKKAITAFMLASILSVSAMTTTVLAAPAAESSTETTQEDQKSEKRTKHCEEAAEPENAIGRDAAKEKALSDAGVTEDQAGRVMAHVSTLDDGTVIYKVHFICDETYYSYQINAVSGAIVDKSSGAVTEDMKKGGRGHGRRGEDEIAEPENAIGKDAAKEKALSDAGVTEDQAGRVMAHVSTLDDGTVIYKVRFICNETGYSYQINAVSGAIVDKSSEAVTEDMKKEGHGRGMWKGDKTADQSAKS